MIHIRHHNKAQAMPILNRELEPVIKMHLERGKSILLLGPRQVGKTTLIQHAIKPDIQLSFANAEVRVRFEKDIVWGIKTLEAEIQALDKKPVIFIDEVQKVPNIMDSIQDMIDRNIAQFILSGSSARKLKHGKQVNLLPGRVVLLHLSPLVYQEMPEPKPDFMQFLNYGSLPGIVLESSDNLKEVDLSSYVSTYLEDEIRQEALVRNVGHFARFLQLAASESGNTINAAALSQDVGVSSTTIQEYYQILDDCMIAHRLDPISKSATSRRLIKSPKYIFFDLGIRRAAANEGINPNRETLGHLFEQLVTLEVLQYLNLNKPLAKLHYWRSSDGPEVDLVIESDGGLIPIEVKITDKPKPKHLKHLRLFIEEYKQASHGYIICQVKHKVEIEKNIYAVSWQDFTSYIFEGES